MKKEKKIILTEIIILVCISTVTIVELNSLSVDISKLKLEKKDLKCLIQDKNSKIQTVSSQTSSINIQINQIQNNLSNITEELKLLRSGERYTLHDPTYFELVSFMTSDKTDKKPYDESSFTCINYAQEVNNNAEEKGIRCGYVRVNLSGGVGHALVVFNTTDRGMVYYEPQSDERVNLRVGKDYWADCVIVRGNYYYERDPNNIVESFIIIW